MNKNKIEVVETDDKGEKVYATKKTVVIASLIPLAVATTPIIYNIFKKETYTATTIPVSTPSIVTTPPPLQIPSMPSSTAIEQMSPVVAQPVGFIADTSLEMLATILDPIVQLMVTISLPIASVIIMASFFYFMFGNAEKAWDMIMKAGLGYVLIQLSPMFLEILKQVGEAV